MNSFRPFVYGLADPADLGHVRYVGMAMQSRRPYEHAKRAQRSSKHSHLLHWIRLLQSEGREPFVLVLELLFAGASRNFVGQIEKMYIDSLRRIGHRLTNVSAGGWGGDCTTPKSRADAAVRMKLPRSAEYLANMSAAQRGKKGSENQRAAVALANAKRIHTDATREKLRRASLGNTRGTGSVRSDAVKAKMSIAIKAAFANGANRGTASKEAWTDEMRSAARERLNRRRKNGSL